MYRNCTLFMRPHGRVLLLCTAAGGGVGVRLGLAGPQLAEGGFEGGDDAGEGGACHVVGRPALVQQRPQLLHTIGKSPKSDWFGTYFYFLVCIPHERLLYNVLPSFNNEEQIPPSQKGDNERL